MKSIEIAKGKYSAFLLLFLLWISGPAFSSDVEKLMHASGVTNQLNSFPDMLKAGINQTQQSTETNPVSSLITRAVDQSIQPIIIQNNIRNLLEKKMSKQELAKLLEWYNSDLGKRITRAEEFASTPDGYSMLAREAHSIAQDRERLELIAGIEEAIRATEFSYELQVGTQVGIMGAMSRVINPEKPVDTEQFANQFRAQELQMKQILHENVLVSLAFSYRDFSEAEIKAYTNFLNTAEAQKFNQYATQELKESLLRGMSVLGENVARNIAKP